MIPKGENKSISLIINVLHADVFKRLNKSGKDFMITVLWHILSIKGKINFSQLGRFSELGEQTFRNQFEKKFDFTAFNSSLIKQVVSKVLIIAFDPSYIPKAGKHTFGSGKYWSGVARKAKWGLDICGFAVVDVLKNTALHLQAWQTPSPEDLKKKSLTLLTHYANLVVENADKFKEFSAYMVADAYFSKKIVVDKIREVGLHFISRLRDDSVLMYKFTGKRTGKKGAPKKFAGRVNVLIPNQAYFSLDLKTDEITIQSAIVWSRAFKRDIKLAIAVFYKDGRETARKLYFATDLELCGGDIVKYYRSRFQIEFLYRDAKQFTGLTTCQARSEKKLDFHFNASLTAVNLAKHDWISNENSAQIPFSMSDYKTLYNNTMMLERFMHMFAINPYTAKNRKIVKELLDYGKIAA